MFRGINKLTCIICTFLCSITISFAQEKEEEGTIDTERLLIVKAYTPTISDAFKIKSTPVLNDSVTQQKKQIKYSIFSVPVASTFTPAKGKAAAIDKAKKVALYDNYGTLGFGNYTSVLAEFYSNFQLNRTDNVGVYMHHNSSQGGITDAALDDKFYNTSLDLNYTSRTKKSIYGIQLGAEHQLYNWYGLSDISTVTPAQLTTIDPQQNYFGANLGGKLELKDSYFKKASLGYRIFGDALGSLEHHAKVDSQFSFEISKELITTNFIIDYLGGSFERSISPLLLEPNEYSILNVGVQPSLLVLRDNLTLNLGASVFYSLDTENEDINLYVYPLVTASYRLINEAAIAYGGLEGGLKQNTYRDAVQVNPYVSPTVALTPTHNQFDAYVGFKGKLSDVFSYNFRGSIKTEDNTPLFVSNRAEALPLEGYDYGNSFSYRYDDIITTSGYGELNFKITKKFNLGMSAEYFMYSTDKEQEAWNLPTMKASLFSDYQITKEWFAGVQLFYVGERKDLDVTSAIIPLEQEATVTLANYFDANINLGYRFNDKLSVFVKGNNLMGQNYERWSNFPVQGIQVLGGITYKFNY